MQTHEWEALLDGTTEGPWKWHWDGGLLVITDPNGKAITIDAEVKDSDLIAAAPEAVAEVVRLRKAMEAVRDEYRRKAVEEHWRFNRSIGPFTLSPVFNEMADALTRILEGDTDE